MTGTRLYGGVAIRNRAYRPASGLPIRPTRTELIYRDVVIPINFADGTSENPTNFKFPATAIFMDCYVNIRTAEATGATKTFQVGTATADSGTNNAFLDGCISSATGLVDFQNCGPVAVTLGSSPATFTAAYPLEMTLTGGTVSSITLSRNSTATAALASATPYSLSMMAGDSAVVTYTGIPTVKTFQAQPGALTSVGGKRISWTPGSADWANFDADLIVRYAVMGDLKQSSENAGTGPEQGVD